MDIRTDIPSLLRNGAVDHGGINVASPHDGTQLNMAMGLPQSARPEDIFLAWFFSLPDSADIAAAARIEIERVDAAAPCEKTTRLRSLLLQATMPALPRQGRKRQRH